MLEILHRLNFYIIIQLTFRRKSVFMLKNPGRLVFVQDKKKSFASIETSLWGRIFGMVQIDRGWSHVKQANIHGRGLPLVSRSKNGCLRHLPAKR